MGYTNGYFQLDIKEDGTYIIIFPPQDGGNLININEVTAYIEKQKIHEYNIAELNKFIQTCKTKTEFKLTNEVIGECPETSIIKVSKDRMYAVIRLYPPSTKGAVIDKRGILGELERNKIVVGISEKVIDIILSNKQYCKDLPIARGIKPVEGKNASIEYHFDTNPTGTPELLEDGSVDFHKLNIFSEVKKGDVLATLSPADFGKEGKDIFGNKVLPMKLKNLQLKHGRNITLTADKLQLISEVNGDVKLEDDTVFVSDTYTVPADVDASTGDIEYEGNVVVCGNVRTGFTIKAQGDIEIKGVVEGAHLCAGGNIVLKRGMQGMNKGLLEAGEDIVTKFLESGYARAGKNVNTGSILHCDVEAKDKVIVSGRKGFIIGGNVIAKNLIEANSAGNKMGTITNLKVGVDVNVMNEAKMLEKNIEGYNEQKAKLVAMLNMFKMRLADGKKLNNDQLRLLKDAGVKVKSIEDGMEKDLARLEECNLIINARSDGKIVIGGVVYPGVRVTISNRIHYVKEERSHCQYKLEAEAVTTSSGF